MFGFFLSLLDILLVLRAVLHCVYQVFICLTTLHLGEQEVYYVDTILEKRIECDKNIPSGDKL